LPPQLPHPAGVDFAITVLALRHIAVAYHHSSHGRTHYPCHASPAMWRIAVAVFGVLSPGRRYAKPHPRRSVGYRAEPMRHNHDPLCLDSALPYRGETVGGFASAVPSALCVAVTLLEVLRAPCSLNCSTRH